MNISDTINTVLNVVTLIFIALIAVQFSAYALIRYAKRYQWAIIIYNCLVKLNPFDATVYVNRSWAYLGLKGYQQAIQSAERAIALNPDLATAYHNRGTGYVGLKEYQQAVQDFNQALELDPNDASTYRKRSVTYYRLKEYQQAIQDCNHALELDPNDACAYHSRGMAYLGLKDIEQSLADFTKAQGMYPNHIDHHWMAEWAGMILEGPDAGEAERLESIPAVDPQSYTAYACRGVALWLRGSFEQALIELEQAVVLAEV